MLNSYFTCFFSYSYYFLLIHQLLHLYVYLILTIHYFIKFISTVYLKIKWNSHHAIHYIDYSEKSNSRNFFESRNPLSRP